MDYANIAKGISILSPFALIIVILAAIIFWLLWRVIPNIQKDFKESLDEAHKTNEKQAAEFRLAVAALQASFLQTLEKERHSHASAMQAAVASNVSLEKSIDRLTMAIMGGRPAMPLTNHV